MIGSRRPIHVLLIALMALPCGLLTSLPAAEAAPEDRPYLMGFPWEAEIVEGIDEQDRDRRRNKPLAPMIRALDRKARRRGGSLPTLYLLGRAYGLRFAAQRAAAKRAQSDTERQRLENAAERDRGNATSAYQEALRLDANCYFAHHDLAVLELQREGGLGRRAYEHLVRALSINKRYVDARRKLIRLFLQRNQHKEVRPHLEGLLRQVPDDTVARTQLVMSCAQLGLWGEAERHVDVLLRGQPSSPVVLDLKAQVLLSTGRSEEALEIYKRIARLSPSVPAPFLGMLRVLEGFREQDPQSPPRFDDYIFAMRGLQRIERDPERRAKLEADIQTMENARHAPPPSEREPGRMPTPDEVLRVLREGAKEEDRARAIYFFVVRDEPPEPYVIKAIARHLSPSTEPAPGVRVLAVRALAHAGGTATIPLVRLALADPDASVRGSAVDSLVQVGLRDPTVRSPLVVVLSQVLADIDASVASAARLGILRLVDVHLELAEDANESTRRDGFRRWWHGAEGEDRLVTGLESYHRLKDRFPSQVVGGMLTRGKPAVSRAAYDLLRRAAEDAPNDARGRWLRSLPTLTLEDWTPARIEATRARLGTWRAARP